MAAEYLFCAISDFASPSRAGTDLGSLFSATLNSSMAASSWSNWLSATPKAMWLRGFSGFNRVAIRSSRAARAGWLLCSRARDKLKWASHELGSNRMADSKAEIAQAIFCRWPKYAPRAS